MSTLRSRSIPDPFRSWPPGPLLCDSTFVPDPLASQLGDGIDRNDRPFLDHFPYLATPNQGYDHTHHRTEPVHPPEMQHAGLTKSGSHPSSDDGVVFAEVRGGRDHLSEQGLGSGDLVRANLQDRFDVRVRKAEAFPRRMVRDTQTPCRFAASDSLLRQAGRGE